MSNQSSKAKHSDLSSPERKRTTAIRAAQLDRYFLGISAGGAGGPAAARSKVFFGELAKRVGNGAGASEYDRSVSDGVPSEAIPDGVDSAIGGPARHTSLAAGAARLIRKPKRKLKLHLRVLLEMRY